MEESHYIQKARNVVQSVKGKPLSVELRREKAIEIAAYLVNEARRVQSYTERIQQEQLSCMMKDPVGLDFTTTVTDECFRSNSYSRIASQLQYIIKKLGVPEFLSFDKRLQLNAFRLLGEKGGGVFVPLAQRMIRKAVSNVILSGDRSQLRRHIQQRKLEGIRVNINHLGEAILGEEDAHKRLNVYLNDLKNPSITYISVKISSIFSQLNLLAEQHTIDILSERLRKLYRMAIQHKLDGPNGEKVAKFVNLDMEEYNDLHLTVTLFKKVLDEPEFFHLSAGIVLQAYLPDAYLYQQELTLWAMKRIASGGAPIKIRIVKGANLAMEQMEARLECWSQAPYIHKVDVDANFKRMLIYGSNPDHVQAVSLGVGSHNVFDIAYALLLRSENNIEEFVQFEMLEGMADHIRRAVQQLSGDMIYYCPVANDDEFQYAVAYLVRRLDENTSPENFLRHVFDLIPGTRDWQQQASLFSLSCHAANTVSFKTRRVQNRLLDPPEVEKRVEFQNEPNTDWALLNNRKWIQSIFESWKNKEYEPIPLVIGGKEVLFSDDSELSFAAVVDPSYAGAPLCQITLANEKWANEALETAVSVETEWGETTPMERSEIMGQVARELRKARGNLIGSMVANGGKIVKEADPEVSEAIDFVEYYRRNFLEWCSKKDVKFSPKGPTLVLPPWNFPCAISVGGIAAALIAGNPVLYKPPIESALVGYEIVKAFWRAGISSKILQFIPCEEEIIGSKLIKDPRVKNIILTGSSETAKKLLKMRPGIDMSAETGGKNAMIVTGLADRDLAIKNVVHSAFSHAGQKCSACSLLILEKEVYQDKNFLAHLKDAVKSCEVGSSWNFETRINPLIHPPGEALMRGLTELEPGEKWLLKPYQDDQNPNLWHPGIKIGVKEGSFSHQTELFGPVLSIMCAENLDHAIQLANSVPYGLTSGIHTLDERESEKWNKEIQAGNCYINRGITGAIVQRQPFGGTKDSSFGTGMKAGGPNYLLSFMHTTQSILPSETATIPPLIEKLGELVKNHISNDHHEIWKQSIASYCHAFEHVFSKQHDPTSILGQDNILSYRPREKIVVLMQEKDSEIDLFRVIAACILCRTPVEISYQKESLFKIVSHKLWSECPLVSFVKESVEDFTQRLQGYPGKRIRILSPVSEDLESSFAEHFFRVHRSSVLANGRVELVHYLREVSLSYDYHRYGNIAYFDIGKKRINNA